MTTLHRAMATVADIQQMRSRGPWQTKSGGRLNVNFAMSKTTLDARFFNYRADELAKVPQDIRGLRMYTVRGLPQDSIGGAEWHRIREEMVFCITGSVDWTCEDVFGNTRKFALDVGVGIWMPPFILHTYQVAEDDSALLVLANTLFDPADPATHDTYSTEAFRALQAEYRTT